MSQKKLSSEVLTLLQREFDQGKINDVVNLLREDNRESKLFQSLIKGEFNTNNKYTHTVGDRCTQG